MARFGDLLEGEIAARKGCWGEAMDAREFSKEELDAVSRRARFWTARTRNPVLARAYEGIAWAAGLAARLAQLKEEEPR